AEEGTDLGADRERGGPQPGVDDGCPPRTDDNEQGGGAESVEAPRPLRRRDGAAASRTHARLARYRRPRRPDHLPLLRVGAGVRDDLEGADPRGVRRRHHERHRLRGHAGALARSEGRPGEARHAWEVPAVPEVLSLPRLTLASARLEAWCPRDESAATYVQAMPLAWILFDWGGTLMSEDGPANTPMALLPEVRAIDGATDVVAALAARHRIAFVAPLFSPTELRCLREPMPSRRHSRARRTSRSRARWG